MAAVNCPVCGKFNTRESGVPFPTDSAKFIRYCLQLQISPREANKRALICFDHFDPKDLIRDGQRITGVSQLAVPTKSKKTRKPPTTTNANVNQPTTLPLDQLLAKTVGVDISMVDFNFRSSATPSTSAGQMGATGMVTQHQQATTANIFSAAGGLIPTTQLLGLARRTLVICRRKKSSDMGSIDQRFFKTFLNSFFKLPPTAVQEVSSVSDCNDLSVIFVVLDNTSTLETIMNVYNNTSPETYQCTIHSATETLKEGATTFKRQFNANMNSTESVALEESLNILLKPMPFLAKYPFREELWHNLAAAILPTYRNLFGSNAQGPADSFNPTLSNYGSQEAHQNIS